MTNQEQVQAKYEAAKVREVQLHRVVYGIFNDSRMLSFGWWSTPELAWKSAKEEVV